MVTMHFQIAQMILFLKNIFSHLGGPRKQFGTNKKLSWGRKVGQSRYGSIGYPISVLIWEMAYSMGIPTRIPLLCTSRFFQNFYFGIQHTFLHKNRPSNLLASTTWLNLLLALWLHVHKLDFFKARVDMECFCKKLSDTNKKRIQNESCIFSKFLYADKLTSNESY